jgi:RNA polymerase sigma-70 factor (ECF subfamily)
MHNEELQVLMVESRGGDLEAFSRIVLYFQAPLSRYLAHIVGEHSLAEDLTQDTFLELFESLQRTDLEVRHVRAWLYKAATNNALSVIRRRRRFAWGPLSWLLESTAHDARETQNDETAIERQMVRETLAKLPPAHAACLLMHDSAGFKCAEIAEQQGISLNAAKQRLARARRAFIKAYKDRGSSGQPETSEHVEKDNAHV